MQYPVIAEVLRTSLIFLLLTMPAAVFAGPQHAATGLPASGGAAVADSPEATPAESSPDPSAPASPAPAADRFVNRAWASRELTYRPFSAQAGGGYDFVTGSAGEYIRDGADATAGVTWFPSPVLPLGLRLDGSYDWFKPGRKLLGLGGVGYNQGERKTYGADLDLQWDFARRSSRQRTYLLGGFGEYRVATSLQKLSAAPRVCGTNFCGSFPTVLAAESDTSAWEPSWNAGVGWMMALDAHTSLFVEARYRRIFTRGSSTQFVPVRIGLRF